MGPEQCRNILNDWHFWRLPHQEWRKGENRITTMVAGRGAGKTWVGSHACNEIAEDWKPDSTRMILHKGRMREERTKYNGHMLIAGPTESDVRDSMIEGESGILSTAKPGFMPEYSPTTLSVTWPNGFIAHLRTGKNPEKIRSLNLCWAWIDEFCFWQQPEKAWNNLRFALRRGWFPEVLMTTTPLPIDKLIEIMGKKGTKVMTGSTFDNQENLNREVVQELRDEFEGTDLGDQELYGKVIMLKSWAMWKVEDFRRIEYDDLPEMKELIVSIDPAGGTASKQSDETGITGTGEDFAGNIYVFEDISIDVGSEIWSDMAVNLAIRLSEYGKVRIIGESNFGGDMVLTCIRSCDAYRNLASSKRPELELTRAVVSKGERAEPLAQRYKKGRAFHVGSPRKFTKLEYQLCHWDPRKKRHEQKSPDRMDALVHAGLAHIGDGALKGKGMKGWAKAAQTMRKAAARA